MSSLNRAELIGRLGADPEMRTLNGAGDQAPTAACNIRIATDQSYKKADGTKIERTEWHRITAFGKLAEIMGEHLKKGRLVFISGELKTRKWTDKDNVDRYTTEIVARDMKFLDSAKKSEPAAAAAEADMDPEVPY